MRRILVLFPCLLVLLTSLGAESPQSFVEGLGLGYNLGNTLDATGGTKGNEIANFEVAWGAPVTTKAIFEDLKDRGFDTIRIPVAWSNLMADDDTIHPDLMNRVEEIVTMVLDSQMHAIVNIHWDGGWIAGFSTDYDRTMAKYRRIWTQISDRFRDYDQRLVFESMNEEGVFNDLWNRYSDGNRSPKKKAAFDLLNRINQTFVDLVRGSGGQNATRYLLIAGYATDIELTCSPEFQMPADPARHLILSVHEYTPSTFTILEKDADWGKSARTWGTDAEEAQLKADFWTLKTHFIDQGIPVILGEYGTVTANKDPDSVRRYLEAVARDAWGVGICPILWGAADQHYDRRALKFTDPALGDFFLGLSRTPRANLAPEGPPSLAPSVVAEPTVEQADPAPAAAPAAPAVADAVAAPLDEAVGGHSGNLLPAEFGPVALVVDRDTSYTSNDPVAGATAQMVEFAGQKALKVTKNRKNEIRVAFVFDHPITLAGKTSLVFQVAGFQGWQGSYNCGLLYTQADAAGARQGSFYVGTIQPNGWTTVAANLAFDEQWGKNFAPDKPVYGIQFWTNQSKVLYIAGLTVQ